MDWFADLRNYVSSLDPAQKKELDKLIEAELQALWRPEPENEPQVQAYYSKADLLLYGGAVGGGKTDLICGCAITQHEKSVIFRRQSTDLRGIEERLLQLTERADRRAWNGSLKILRLPGRMIELGHLEKPNSEKSWQGRPHDFIGIDEGAQLASAKISFVLGWLRTTNRMQRCRAIIGSNPPTGTEGEWLFEWFAPWVDDKFPDPAKFGELRYAITARDKEGTTLWVPDARPLFFTAERSYRPATEKEIEQADANEQVVFPKTRTFIQSLLKNNPYYAEDGRYRAQVQTLPEPLRSQLLKGDFSAGRQDHEWQVIPTAWVREAMARWSPEPPNNAIMTAIGVDVAQGGADDTVIAPRHGSWFAIPTVRAGIVTPTGSEVAALVVQLRRNNAVIIIDMGGGYGGATKMRLEDNEIKPFGYNGAEASHARTVDKQLEFKNKRAETHWRFREALDPDQDGGSHVAIPPDPMILADLTATRWKLTTQGIQVESKDELKKPERLGRSPDRGDAIIIAWSEGERRLIAAQRKAARGAVTKPSSPFNPQEPGTGWLR